MGNWWLRWLWKIIIHSLDNQNCRKQKNKTDKKMDCKLQNANRAKKLKLIYNYSGSWSKSNAKLNLKLIISVMASIIYCGIFLKLFNRLILFEKVQFSIP